MVALDAARSAGAQYADVRISRNRNQSINTRERRVQGIQDNETFGFIDLDTTDETFVLAWENPDSDNPWIDANLQLSYSNTLTEKRNARTSAGVIRTPVAPATALSSTETVVLPRERFRELIATEAGVRDALLASIAGELRRLTTHVEELHFLDITGRLAARLVRLANESGTRLPDGGIRLRRNLTQGDLAAMVGCTRQSVNKLLGQFTDDGYIRLEREGIVVTDIDGLGAASRR